MSDFVSGGKRTFFGKPWWRKDDNPSDDNDDDEDDDDDIPMPKHTNQSRRRRRRPYPTDSIQELFRPPLSPQKRPPLDNSSSQSFLAATSFASWCQWGLLSTTLVLYILNQTNHLPLSLSAIVSKVLFWPTLPITILHPKRIGHWYTVMEPQTIVSAVVMTNTNTNDQDNDNGDYVDTATNGNDNTDSRRHLLLLGGAPFDLYGLVGLPQKLYHRCQVRSVINLCAEYAGPQKAYQRLGIPSLRLPTIDHCIPSIEHLRKGVEWIYRQQEHGDGTTYVHCRAGHGRSAAVVYCYLLDMAQRQQYVQDQQQHYANHKYSSKVPPTLRMINRQRLNQELCKYRYVKSKLWNQPTIVQFHNELVQELAQHDQTTISKKRLPNKPVIVKPVLDTTTYASDTSSTEDYDDDDDDDDDDSFGDGIDRTDY